MDLQSSYLIEGGGGGGGGGVGGGVLGGNTLGVLVKLVSFTAHMCKLTIW